MIKLQKLHDFLVKTALVPEESIQVYITEGGNYSPAQAGFENQFFTDRYTAEIFIKNYPFLIKDHRLLHGALNWWLNAFEAERKPNAHVFEFWVDDINTSSTVNLFFSFELSETTSYSDGEFNTCIEPVVDDSEIIEIMPESLRIYLERKGIDAEILIFGEE